MADDASSLTKEQLLSKLAARSKAELVDALGSALTKDDLVSALGSKLKKDDLVDLVESPRQRESSESDAPSSRAVERQSSDDRDLDWDAELDWSRAPAPTPPPVRYSGAGPSLPGQRVRVDVSGLPMLGVFAGRGATAAGTITGVDARAREVTVYLDAGFDGQKEIVIPPERIVPEG
jgi:hypothetical protein